VTEMEHLVKRTLVLSHNQAMLRYAQSQRQLFGVSEDQNNVSQFCCLILFRFGQQLVMWGTGLQKRFGSMADASA
jgi:hypothetical protein